MKRLLIIILTILMTASIVLGCSPQKKNYIIEQDKYLFGLGEMPYMNGGAVDSKTTPALVADLAGALGIKSYRIWMHLSSVIQREDNSDNISLNQKRVNEFHVFIDSLKANGITHFTAMSHYYIYPYDYSVTSSNVIPDPDTEYEMYLRFLSILEKCYELLSAEFPEIKYWEPGNETNASNGRFVAMNGYSESADASTNAPYLYSDSDLAYITADLCYYANRGIKKSNKENMLVLPGMIFSGDMTAGYFLELIYEQIESKWLPTAEKYADTNSDNYFQIINWHPYVGSWRQHDQNWINANKAIYQVAIDHGDNGKKVFLTEVGWQDQGNTDNRNGIATYFVDLFVAIKKEMPWVETVHIFRLVDWETSNLDPSSIERFFGLFTSPNNVEYGCTPKPAALSLFKYFNGENADSTPLYKYSIKNLPN